MSAVMVSSRSSYRKKPKRKSFPKKKYRNPLRTQQDRLRSFLKELSLVVIVLLAIVFLVVLTLQKTVFSYENTIQTVSFTDESIQRYNDPYVYKALQDALEWMNYYYYRFLGKGFALDEVQHQFPFVQDIEIVYMNAGFMKLHVSYEEPHMVIENTPYRWGIYGDIWYPLFSWNTLWSWQRVLYFPQYLTGTSTLSGLFFPLSASRITQHFHAIRDNVPDVEKVVYLAWGEKMAVLLAWGKRVFVNNRKDIYPQLIKLSVFQSHFKAMSTGLMYENIGQIDVGSLDYVIIKTW